MPLRPPSAKPNSGARIGNIALAEISLRADPHFEPNERPQPVISVQYGLIVIRDDSFSPLARQVQLNCKLSPLKPGTHPPYNGQSVVIADLMFHAEGNLSAEEMDEHAAWIGFSPLVGANRAYLQMISGVGAFTRLLLGPVKASDVMPNAMVLESSDSEPRRLYPATAASTPAPDPAKPQILGKVAKGDVVAKKIVQKPRAKSAHSKKK